MDFWGTKYDAIIAEPNIASCMTKSAVDFMLAKMLLN
jgi:hypothetical protein